MGKYSRFTSSMALILAGVMLWATPSLAQGRGKGQRGQGGRCAAQGWEGGPGQGRGPGSGACPYYSGSGNYQGRGGNNPQAGAGRRGSRGGVRANQPDTRPNLPPVTQ